MHINTVVSNPQQLEFSKENDKSKNSPKSRKERATKKLIANVRLQLIYTEGPIYT